MSNQYPSVSNQHAAHAPHAVPTGPQSTVPPPPDPREMWSTEEVMSLVNEERAQREQTYQELAQWQHYAQQLQAEHAQLQAQYERISQSTGNSIPPGTVSDEHAHNLELQLQSAQERIHQTAAELEAVRSEAQVANQQLRMLQDHVDSIPPEAPASFPPAADAHGFAPPAYEPPPAEDYATPTGQGRRYSLGVLALVVGVLVASGAAAHFGVFAPQLEAERETTRRTQELMRSETERLRSQLDAQREAQAQEVAELTKQLREAKAAAQAGSAHDGSEAAAVEAPKKPSAKKRRASARRRKAARRRSHSKHRKSAKRRSSANDPIAGIGL